MTEQRIDLGLTSTSATGGGCGAGCGCGHGAAASTASAERGDSTATDVLRVEGMTCEHCVRAVTDELNALDGVRVVDIDLRVGDASLVRIEGTADDAALIAAIDEAGYTLVR
ncbi:heavy-metal-associated domain-containing protein [Microbacterium testaceum]|uniref:heavy-metal-associated domain-containing protein n=1 Tax=Microbacterium testaceum TaxID=2033 RepID=UPI0012490D1F|nr:cation transporter [Microbacterium testaceum]